MRAEAFRLHPGADLKQELQRLVAEHAFRAACIVSCIGSLSSAGIRLAGADSTSEFEGPLEIISLAGTLAPDGVHAHICVAASDGRCIGGHLGDGCIINTTAELVIGDHEVDVAGVSDRRDDEPRSEQRPHRSQCTVAT